MKIRRTQVVVMAMLGVLAVPPAVLAHQEQAPPSKQNQAPSPLHHLTIEVTGGETDKPVENASVYVKKVEQRLIIKDKKFEVNVKTDKRGLAHVPDAPLGRVLIQIVADGWKPYGRWYEITDPKQVIKIHLDRPPKWY